MWGSTVGQTPWMVFITRQPPAPDRGFGPASSIRWISWLLLAALPLYLFWTVRTIGGTLDFDAGTVLLLSAAVASEFGAKWAFAELFRDGFPSACSCWSATPMQPLLATGRRWRVSGRARCIAGRHAAGAPISRRSAFRAALVGTGVARLIPAGGAITPVAMAWSVGARSEGASAAAFRATVLNYGGLLFGAGAGLLLTSTWHDVGMGGVAVVIGVGASAVGVLIIAASARIGVLTRVVPRRWRAQLEETFVDLPLSGRSMALLAARVLLEAATLGCTLRAFGLALPASTVVAAFGLSQVVGGLPGPPGGLGFTEVGLAAMLGYVGIPTAVVASPVLVFRVFSYWLPAAGGVLAIASTLIRKRGYRAVEVTGNRRPPTTGRSARLAAGKEPAPVDTGVPAVALGPADRS